MGCESTIGNTNIANKQFKFISAFKDVSSMQTKLNDNSNFPINCFLISAQSIPNFLNIILNSKEESDRLENLIKYQLETNIKVYDDINTCLEIYYKNDESNKFVIVGEDFIKNMEIKEGNQVKLEKNNDKIKVVFKDKNGKIIIIKDSDYIYKFSEYESTTSIQADNFYSVEYNDNNLKNSFLVRCLINGLFNIDLFKKIFLENEKTIIENKDKYKISNIIIDIIKKNEENKELLNKERKAFIDLNEIIDSKKMLSESKYLIGPFIKNLSDEFNNPNIINNLFANKDQTYSICQNCNNKNEISINFFYSYEFNLENVRTFKFGNKQCLSTSINIKDCFDYQIYSKINANYTCNICSNKIIKTNLFYKIEMLPEILIIILNRENFIETNNRIEFDIEFKKGESHFDLPNLSINNNKIIYDLIRIFSYKKDSEYKNKFYHTVFCKSLNENKWIFYDKYDKKEIQDICNEMLHTPYMLIYIKK